MKTVIGVVMLILGSVSTDIAGECDMAGFYLELGCTPVPSATNGTCPESFTCPDLHPDPTACYYKGVAYADKATIAQNLISNPCSQACSCSVYNNEPSFLCAAVDCFETFDSDLNQQCINTYELDACCNTGSVCGKDAIAELKTCEVDGQTYREGQMFEPANTKKTCICTANWDGNVENSTFCRDINCGIEIHYQNNILQNCAPIFVKNMRTCPIGFECPSSTTKVIRGLNIKSLSDQCVFGNMSLTIGDEVTAQDQCTKCTCSVPPFVNCVRQTSCDV